MIKFNQFVQGAVLSLTIAGGLAFADHASAYDNDDYIAAQDAHWAAQVLAENAEDAYNAYDYFALKSDAEDDLGINIDACNRSYASNAGLRDACIFSAFDQYEDTIDDIEDTYNTLTLEYYSTADSLMDAYNWFQYVANNQNGIHGQP